GSFQPSSEMMLQFYSYYKQATQGPCNLPRPGFWDPVGKYKWDAWNGLGDMSREEAMIAYVEEMKKLKPEVERYEWVVIRHPELSLAVPPRNAESPQPPSEDAPGSSDPLPPFLDARHFNTSKAASMFMAGSQESIVIAVWCARRVIQPGEDRFASWLCEVTGLRWAFQRERRETKPEGTVCPHRAIVAFTGQMPKHSEDVSSLHHLTSDSDSEVYCDSMEQLGQEESSEVFLNQEVNHSQLSPRMGLPEPVRLCSVDENHAAGSLQGGAEGVKRGGEDGKPSGNRTQKEGLEKTGYSGLQQQRGSRTQAAGRGVQGVQLGSGGDGDRWGTEDLARGSLNEQIGAVLTRLQEDMKSVLQRLHTLEALTNSQTQKNQVNIRLLPDSMVTGGP
ncbi:UNVERIFIED_CONTAM: hypothetical protein FKN15_041943, partial [Acipenser sinensis]